MNSLLIKDRRVTGLLNRVRKDVGHLRDDIGDLLNHTTKETLPNSARELAGQAKQQLAAGGAYAANRLRNFRSQPQSQCAGLVGGAVVLGLLAFGAYSLFKHNGNPQEVADEVKDEIAG